MEIITPMEIKMKITDILIQFKKTSGNEKKKILSAEKYATFLSQRDFFTNIIVTNKLDGEIFDNVCDAKKKSLEKNGNIDILSP